MKGVRPVGFLDKLFGRKKTTREQPVQPADQPAIASDREEPVAAEPQEGVAMEPVTPAFQLSQPSPAPEATPAEENPADAPPPASPQREWDAVTQRKLDRYFARLREIYPDGVIARLNTGHKKLAERGAQLRRLLGMEGELDAFFALGGFTYCRKGGGRPPLPLTDADCEAMHARIRLLFPDGVPLVMAVREADHRLYLDLRAVARREGKTLGDYLREKGLMAGRANLPEPPESSADKG